MCPDAGHGLSLRESWQPCRRGGLGYPACLLAALLLAGWLSGCAGRPDPFRQQAIRAQEVSLKGQELLNVGEDRRAQKSFEKSLTINQSIDNPLGTARQLNNLGAVALSRGDLAEARQLFQEALLLNQGVGDSAGAAINLANLATAAYKGGDLGRAAGYLEEARLLARQSGSPKVLGQVLCQMAGLTLDRQDTGAAALLLEEARLTARTPEVQGSWNYQQGRLALARGETSRAVDFFQAALTADRQVLNRPGMGADLLGLGQAWEQRAEFTRAFLYYQRAFDLFVTTGSQERARESLAALHRVNRAGGLGRSLKLFEQHLQTGQVMATSKPAPAAAPPAAPASQAEPQTVR